ncbi:unnamed protein product [Porites evermanni]|uniref:Uncharacterized protein n=1 Tax=Porites evermanni TaxID=104178 RepID=A0ABN8MSQ5_9CNID|nr:unnamed protein product [Porites evermanni]
MEDNASSCAASSGPSNARNMEWTEEHDIQLAREVLLSEPFRFKPRTVEHGKCGKKLQIG